MTLRRPRDGALSGIRVLELAHFVAGPYCGQLLGDLGADVLKIEKPGQGDPSRTVGRPSEAGVLFMATNRNKRSLAIDLAHAAGREVFLRLTRTSDVLLDGHRPGVLERLGVGYEVLSREAPRLIYCALSGYGQDGPYAQRSGHDLNYAAMGGLLDQTGARGGGALPPATPFADLGGALHAALSIVAALRVRDKTGLSQFIDLSLVESAVALLPIQYATMWQQGAAPERGTGMLTGGTPGYGVYVTRDGRGLALGALEEHAWKRLCLLLGRPDLVESRFPRDDAERERVETALSMAVAERTRDEWVELLADDEVCAAPVLSPEEATRDPHLVHRDAFRSLGTPDGAELQQVSFPARLSQTPAALFRPPPRLGEHTVELLTELGYARTEIERLEDAKAVGSDRVRR